MAMKNPPPAGEIVLELINMRSDTISDFERKTGINAGELSEIVDGRRRFSFDESVRISEEYGISAYLLMRMQNAYFDVKGN